MAPGIHPGATIVIAPERLCAHNKFPYGCLPVTAQLGYVHTGRQVGNRYGNSIQPGFQAVAACF